MVILPILLNMVSPYGYHTSDVTSPFEPNFISKVTPLNKD